MTEQTGPEPKEGRPSRRRLVLLVAIALGAAFAVFVVVALLVSIFERKQQARSRWTRLVEVTEETTDPAVWGQNWPHQYDRFKRTVDSERTRYGGSDAIPRQRLEAQPWLKVMWSGYAFSLDYREARGHAYTLQDQDHTKRVLERPQPGACLHCHASIMPAYRHVGQGDVMEGFRRMSAMPWTEARNLTDDQGRALVEHPVSCVDCHSPEDMSLRATRPAFLVGIRALMAHRGIEDYDVNRDASRQEMRSFVCAQCHVEYYFAPPGKTVTFPWAKGNRIEQMEAYYDEIGFSDWTHGVTGAEVLKPQHPEFELWSQGIHAQAGVACADCHMPYLREGAMKISDHHVRSPLLGVSRACQTCHNVPEGELVARVHRIQDRTEALIERAAAALMDQIEAMEAARRAGASDADLARARALQRQAQFRLDFVHAENSHGFHADQESARILAEAIDYARQGEASAMALSAPAREPVDAPPVIGVTPTDEAPPGPTVPDE